MSAMSTSTSSSLTSRNAVDNGRKSSTSITFIVPARRKELSTPTLAVSKKKKKKMLKGNGVDGYDIKRGDVIDRIDVYNQYDEENIEIDEQPVSQEFTVRILASLNRSFIEQSAKAASVYSSRLSFMLISTWAHGQKDEIAPEARHYIVTGLERLILFINLL